MPAAKRADSVLRHWAQVARARRFVRAHVADELRLEVIARAAGASLHHFARLHHALARETVFQTVTRLRLELGARRLLGAPREPVTRIALEVGFRTPSSFDKAFRAALGLSPTELRAAPEEQRQALLARLGAAAGDRPDRPLALAATPELRRRPGTRFAHVRESGAYAEAAALAWAALDARLVGRARGERLGASYGDPRRLAPEALRYQAGVALPDGAPIPAGLAATRLDGGDYAVFRYRGPYRFIAHAFDEIFQGWAHRARPRLRPAPCLETYCTDPSRLPEEAMVADLWIPVAGPA
jgi:AraC family transcriptional regulator